MIKIKHENIEKLKQQILNIINKYLDTQANQIYFFGSRTLNQGDENSDIDIGILGPIPIPLSIMGKIKEDIKQLPILYKIDIVDFNSTSKNFRKIAMETAEKF